MVLLEAQSVVCPRSPMCPSGPRDIITDGKDGFFGPSHDQETLQSVFEL